MIVMPIVRLLFFRSPADIAGFIVFIVIFPIQRMRWGRSPTNIFQKFFKRLPPTFAHDNASTAVAGIPWIPFVVAPILHRAPQVVFRCLRKVTSFAMCGSTSVRGSDATATRTGWMLVFMQILLQGHAGVSAIAAAQPRRSVTWNFHSPNHYQFPKSLTRQIHSNYVTLYFHPVTSWKTVPCPAK